MPRQDRFGSPAAGSAAPSGAAPGDEQEQPPSRRALLRSAAGAGAAGVAATALSGLSGTALAAPVRARDSASHGTSQHAAADDHAEQVVVHVKDARAGEIDIFRGSSVTRLHDPGLAARLVRASRA